jgi:nucleoid-associated protein YgaU
VSVNEASVVPELAGISSGGGQLQKLTIYYEQGGGLGQGSIQALFNPTEISLTKSATWEQLHAAGLGGQVSASVEQEFRSVEAESFSIELLFDTYEARSAALTGARAAATVLPATPVPGRESSDVRQYTSQIAALIEVDTDLHRPPVCNLRWGTFDIFTGVLIRLHQQFTLFLDDGTPVRAMLTCEFAEAATEGEARAGELHSADVVKTRQVRRHDTLHSLAAAEYGDPSLWRPIATANGIVNPRDLQPGMIVTIPKLRP